MCRYMEVLMIYCRNCGNQCADHTQFCPVCGASLQPGYNTQQPNGYVQQPNGTYYYQQPVEEDKPETALCVLSFFFWIVGVVLYAVNSATKPNAAKAYLKWGLISVGISVGLGLLSFLIPMLIMLATV